MEMDRINGEQLNEITARLEQDSDRTSTIESTGRESSQILRYGFEEKTVTGDEWYGSIDIEIYDDSFQARGDEALLNEYFASHRIQDTEIE